MPHREMCDDVEQSFRPSLLSEHTSQGYLFNVYFITTADCSLTSSMFVKFQTETSYTEVMRISFCFLENISFVGR